MSAIEREMSTVSFRKAVSKLRQQHYRPPDGVSISSGANVLKFINQVGFCLLSPNPLLELPDLKSIVGASYLRLKDQLVAERSVYYGRIFRRHGGFVATNLLTSLYALSPAGRYTGDRFEMYKAQYLSADANRLAGIVLAKGPLPARALRRDAGLAAQNQRDRFIRAIVEAESRFLIARVGVTHSEASHYSSVWDAFARHWPEAVRPIDNDRIKQAARHVVLTYLNTVAATTIRQIAAIFFLSENYVANVVDELLEEQKADKARSEDADNIICRELADAIRRSA